MDRRNFIKQGLVITVAACLPISSLACTFSKLDKGKILIPKIGQRQMDDAGTQTTVVKCNGVDVKIHAIQTGFVSVKQSHISKHVAHFLTPIKISFDKNFTEFLPIWCWAIEHPEGVIVIDTGENAGVMNPDYFKAAGKLVGSYSKRNFKFSVTNENEIGFQLQQLGIGKDKIKNVVLTHLHLDHTDGLKDFEGVEIILNEAEFKKPSGDIPELYPKWFKPTLVSYKSNLVDIFGGAYPITQSEDVLLIPTNGHTPNHASVLFRTDHFDILFAGDASYTQEQLLDNDLAGINANYKSTRKTYENINMYGKLHKTIYLPSHDPNSAKRLKNTEFIITTTALKH